MECSIALSDTVLDQVYATFTRRRAHGRIHLGTPVAAANSAAAGLSLRATEVGGVAGEDVAGSDGDVESFGGSVRREVEHL